MKYLVMFKELGSGEITYAYASTIEDADRLTSALKRSLGIEVSYPIKITELEEVTS